MDLEIHFKCHFCTCPIVARSEVDHHEQLRTLKQEYTILSHMLLLMLVGLNQIDRCIVFEFGY